MKTTDDQLVLHLTSRTVDSKGFESDKNRWQPVGTAITVEVGETILLRKPHYSSDVLFYALTPAFFLCSRNWRVLVSLLREYGSFPTPNASYVRDYLQFQCPLTSETFCEQIFSLRHGEVVSLKLDGTREYSLQWNNVPAANLETSTPDIETCLCNQLLELDCNDTLFHISAGLDSSIVSILASELHPGKPIRAVTCETKGSGARDEVDVVRMLEKDFGFDLHVFDFTDLDLFVLGRELVEALGYPIAHPSHLVRFLMDKHAANLASTVITGRGVDECLGGYPWHTDEFANPAKHHKRLRVTSDEWLQQLLVTMPEGDRESTRLWKSNETLPLGLRLQYDLWTIFEAWNIIDEAFARYFGITVTSPFLDSALMRALLSVPDSLRLRNGNQKWLLRDAFAARYPDYLLTQPKRGLRLDVRPYLTEASFSELMDALYGHSAFARKYLHRKGCEQLVREILEGRENLGWQFWSLYLCSRAYELLIDKKG